MRTDSFTRCETGQHIRLAARGNHCVCATLGSTFGRQNFGNHAAFAESGAGTARHGFESRVSRCRRTDESGCGVAARVCRKQPLLVGQDDEHVGLDQIGHQRAEGIVVAELDFVSDDGVVLIDDRDDFEREQRHQGRARIEIALAVGEVVVGEQHLCGFQPMPAKAGFVNLHETHLPHRRSRLQLMNRMRAARPAEALQAFGDGAARDQHDFLAHCAQGSNLLRPERDGGGIEAASVIGDQR